MDKMREEFEAFYESYMLGEGRRIEYIKNEIASFKPERNKYGYSDAQEFWVVWKASRAALCVELPYSGFSEFYGDALHGYATAIDLVRDALIDAGVDGK